MKISLLTVLIVINLSIVYAQPTSPVVIKATTSENQFATLDRAGDLYLIKTSGRIEKYNAAGELLADYSDSIAPTLFDTGNGVRLLSYYRSKQKYLILNPSLSVVLEKKTDTSWAIDPWLICSSSDYHAWVLDAADWSLKKVDTRSDQILTESVIDTSQMAGKPVFTFMREYQNFLFLLEANTGIHIFNPLGRHLRTIETADIAGFNFLGEELYFVENGKIILLDLFTLERRSLPLDNPERFVLLTDEKIFFVTPSAVSIHEFKP